MNSLDLPKHQQDFMRTVRKDLEIITYEGPIPGMPEFDDFGSWEAIGERKEELERMKKFFLIAGTTRALIQDAIDLRLQADDHQSRLLKILLQQLEEKNPEKKDNIRTIQMKIKNDDAGGGTIRGIPIPGHDVLRTEFRKHLGFTTNDFKDPRIEKLIKAHEKMITENPSEGFGAMTNWISRFPDFVFPLCGLDENEMKTAIKEPMNRNHLGLFPEVRTGFNARYLSSMYVSAAIDATTRDDRRGILKGVEQSRRAWSNFWKNVMEAHEA